MYFYKNNKLIKIKSLQTQKIIRFKGLWITDLKNYVIKSARLIFTKQDLDKI